MKRAAVLIGVDRSGGGLPELHDAAAGAQRMAQWAQEQGLDPVTVLTDERGGPVAVADIKRALKAITDPGTIDQLIVYFAGHGVNIGYAEYWLLSGAPDDPQEAVNVNGSVALAQQGSVRHVVFISDACRTAAAGIQGQAVTGSQIFPNTGSGGLEKPVDQFYACLLGRPAHEIADKDASAGDYTALYTEVLTAALWGDAQGEDGYVRPRPLRTYLHDHVLERIKDKGMQFKLIQEPDARIASDPEAWLAKLAAHAPEPPEPEPPEPEPPEPEAPQPDAGGRPTGVLTNLLTPMLAADTPGFEAALTAAVDAHPQIVRTIQANTQTFGPSHFESSCGFKVRGANLAAVIARPDVHVEQLGTDLARVWDPPSPATNVMLVFEHPGGSATGTVLPAVPGFLAALTVEDGELVDVAYEPSDTDWRFGIFREQADDLRALRAVVSSSSRDGVFRLEGEDALGLARRMQVAKGIDPTLGLYAAYAYHDLGRRDLITSMSGYMRDDLGAPLFDVALLARDLPGVDALGVAPLLAQGWSLLDAYGVTPAAGLQDLRRCLEASLWSLYNGAGLNMIQGAISGGHIP
jgi:hypothetical protein